MQTSVRSLVLALGLTSAACGAGWRSLDPLEAHGNPVLEDGLRSTRETHGHRDFPREFEEVWGATVEGLHAGGIAVPLSARPGDKQGTIDVEDLWVHVTERNPGRTCVMLRFRSFDESHGRAEAKLLLDGIQSRLR